MLRTTQLIGAQPVATGILDNRYGLITFWSFVETTGAASAELQLIDGSNATGGLVADITLSAGQSTRDYFPHPFLPYDTGLFLNLVSGAVRGQVFAIVAPDCDEYRVPVEVVNIGALTIDVSGLAG